MKPQTPLIQAKRWGILLYFAAVYTLSSSAACLNELRVSVDFVSLAFALFGVPLIASKTRANTLSVEGRKNKSLLRM